MTADTGDIFCIGCGYNLRGSSERCPECGRGFDASAEGGVARHCSPGRFTRAMLRPLGWFSILLVSGSSVGMFWIGMYPAPYFDIDVALIVLWIVILLVPYMARVIIGGTCAVRCGLPGYRGAGGRRGAALAVVVLLTFLCLVARVPLRLGFLTALPRMEEVVTAVNANGRLMPFSGRAGVYEVRLLEQSSLYLGHGPGTIIFSQCSGSALFIYSPSGKEGLGGRWGHLVGDWYWVTPN